MKAKYAVKVSPQLVAYVAADLRQVIVDHTPLPKRLEGLHGEDLVSRRREIGTYIVDAYPEFIADERADLEWLESDVFPLYLEAEEAANTNAIVARSGIAADQGQRAQVRIALPLEFENRLNQTLASLEIPRSQFAAEVRDSVLSEQWLEDEALWIDGYLYPDRETAERIARSFFARHPDLYEQRFGFLEDGAERRVVFVNPSPGEVPGKTESEWRAVREMLCSLTKQPDERIILGDPRNSCAAR